MFISTCGQKSLSLKADIYEMVNVKAVVVYSLLQSDKT